MKLYVGCALRNAPQTFKDSVEVLKQNLEKDFEVLKFLGDKGTAQEVFRYDIDCVLDSDAVLAVCDFPSLGLGFEIATALANGKRVLGVAQTDADVSRMILGIDSPLFSFERYTSLSDVEAIARTHFG